MTHSIRIIDCELPLTSGGGRWDVIVDGGVIKQIALHNPSASTGADVIDAAGRSLLPGFVDSHVHIPESGVEMLRCDMSSCVSRQDVLDTVAAYCAANPHEEWIVGRGWDSSFFLEVPPSLTEIDAITGPRPAYLNNRDGHSVWVNSAALALAGVTQDTPSPAGGVIDRNADGEITGLLFESAMQLVSDITPAVDRESLRRGLVAAQDYLFSLGVTGWQDAIVGSFVPTTDVYELYRDAAADGTLKGKVTGSLWWSRDSDQRDIAELVALRDALPADGRFQCTSIKIMYDGWFSTRSAAISSPYVTGADHNLGLTFFTPDEIAADVVEIDAHGFDMHFHVVGDRAVSECIEALSKAIEVNPDRDRRHQLAHVWITDDTSIASMGTLGLIANLQPFWARHHDELDHIVSPALPVHLRQQQLRFGSMSRAGVTLASGSDWPVSSANPLDAVHVAVNRQHPIDESSGPFAPHEALTLEQALTAATAGSAYALRRDNEFGTIAAGMSADLVLLDARLSDLALDQLSQVKVAYTLIDGEVVYSAERDS